MPNPTERQSALRTPLNRLLGREANVRVLRVLCSRSEPLGTGGIATLARLSSRSVRQVLGALERRGIVERLGSGRTRLARLDREHPLAEPLAHLFEAEATRVQELLLALRDEAARLAPDLRAAWIHGAVATEQDGFGDPVQVGILAAAAVVDAVTERLQRAAIRLGGEYGVLIDVLGFTRADIEALPPERHRELEHRIPLHGPSPFGFVGDRGGPPPAAHDHLDDRSRDLARAVADRLPADDSIRQRAISFVRGRLEKAPAGESAELREWLDALEHLPTPQLQQLLTADTERARRLRQSLPFVGVLDPEGVEEALQSQEADS